MLNSKLVGGILLIVGTSIGGGMLALPISTAEIGFTNSLFFLFFCWAVMTAGALLILEVNLRLPAGSNMVSMAKATLGLPGQCVAWCTYLFLLYTLLAGYIAGLSDVLHTLLKNTPLESPLWVTSLLSTLVFSFVVYKGIRSVDYVNRGLMFAKLGTYLLLVLIISPHVSQQGLVGGSPRAFTGTLMILISSFGFASIVPSLRDYFKQDINSLRKVILFGSLIPLACYILWDAVIMGVISRQGEEGLIALRSSDHAISGLTTALTHSVHSPMINGFFSFFTSICMVTAFLGVSLGLFDFLADGLKLEKSGAQGRYTLAFTFIPPLIVVLFNPGIYLYALQYAGICCVILLLLLPALMAWQGRKTAILATDNLLVPGGNVSLAMLTAIGVGLLILATTELLHIAL
jgi:tyrosine-specific transport protein